MNTFIIARRAIALTIFAAASVLAADASTSSTDTAMAQFRLCNLPTTVNVLTKDLSINGPCSTGYVASGAPVANLVKVSGWKAKTIGPAGFQGLRQTDVIINVGGSPASGTSPGTLYIDLITPRFATVSSNLTYSFGFVIEAIANYAHTQLVQLGMNCTTVKSVQYGLTSSSAIFGAGAGMPQSVAYQDGNVWHTSGDIGGLSFSADTFVSFQANVLNFPGFTTNTGTYRLYLFQ
jgi:hypothetical protein